MDLMACLHNVELRKMTYNRVRCIKLKKSASHLVFKKAIIMVGGRKASIAVVLHLSRRFHQLDPTGPTDVRSPCPGLNALSNHHILPHSGHSITIPILTTALKSGLNIGADFSLLFGTLAINGVSPDPSSDYFDLDMLNKHNEIEHDASLSRSDYWVSPTRDNFGFNRTVWEQVLVFFEGLDEILIDVAARAREARTRFERGEDGEFTYTAKQVVLAYGESALYLSTMGDPWTEIAPLEFVKVLIGE